MCFVSMATWSKGGVKLRLMSTRFKYLFLLITLFFGSFLIISITNSSEIMLLKNNQPLALVKYRYDVDSEDSYTIRTEGCTIPGLKPLDDSIKSLVKPPTELKSCPMANQSFVLHNSTHLWVDLNMLPYYNMSIEDRSYHCCYEAFYRPKYVEDVYSSKVDARVQYEDCVDFTYEIMVAHEYVRVSCKINQKTFYKQYFVFAREKPKSFTEEKKVTTTTTPTQTPMLSYNVVVMGIDAVSRLNFYRTMPNTLAFLKEKGAIELLGYNKVDDNTFPNVVPMLMGVKESELRNMCWPRANANFDNCPFIWNEYARAGFYTAFGEDSGFLGTFTFGRNGFIQTPTDYYLRTFTREAETVVGNTKDYNSLICMGNRYFYKVLLDYIEDLMATLKSSKLFGFFWEVSMSHDYLNYPMAMDDSYRAFLESLDKTKRLDNTIMILLSDHGIRWGSIRLTKQGRLEERLPFVHVLLPSSFKYSYNSAYENIKQNRKRLTSPFDIYATLADLIDLSNISDENIKKRFNTSYAHDRGISLFLPIPKNRTCEMVNIDDHWCTCHKEIKMVTESTEARTVATELVKHLNSLLAEYPRCAKLTLQEVIDVTEMVAGIPREDEVGWKEYMAIVRTSPGDGVFEGTLRYKDVWSVSGSVSRLNLYGDQSSCINHYQMKLYCFCS